MIPPPPRSTLFPYTTLFRSTHIQEASKHRAAQIKQLGVQLDSVEYQRNAALLNRAGRDRKSTRLNSSHGYISYAVFCLKKKKKKYTLHSLQLSVCTARRAI